LILRRAALGGLFAACFVHGAAPAADPLAVHRFYAVAISPDGTKVASVETGEGKISPALVLRPVAGGPAVPVAVPCESAAGCGVLSPVWSPDGSRLAFGVAPYDGNTRALFTVDAQGGTPERLLRFEGTLIALRFSRDGHLAALANAGATEVGPAHAAPPETGVIGAQVHEQRIGIVQNGALRWASPPDLYVYEYDWLPDGTGLVGTAAPGDGNANWWGAKLYRFAADGGAARVIYAPTDPQQQIAQPKVSPEGTEVSFIGGLMSDFENPGGDAFVLRLGETVPRNLSQGSLSTVLTLQWGCAAGHLLTAELFGPRTYLWDLDSASGMRSTLWSGLVGLNGADTAVSLTCHAAGPVPVSATIRESFTSPPEIAAGPVGDWHNLTAHAVIRAPVAVRNLEWRSDGQRVQGWLLTPSGGDPAVKRPMITYIHGGPAWAEQPYYLNALHRSLLDHDYALFLPNPRGSYGQGEAFTRAVAGDIGQGDLRDVLAGVDAAIATGLVDPQRLGLAGTSYGGFMAMWAPTQTSRFRAAVAHAGISDWRAYAGQTGIAGWLPPYFGASVYDDPARYDRASPIAFIGRAKTPTLLLVGDRDIECPAPQSREFWQGLRAMGTPTEFVIYPGAGHEDWNDKDEADADRRTIAWFDRYLGP
jgi:dipeptidyl aminopeptidase/acylaminoacyl peptidase